MRLAASWEQPNEATAMSTHHHNHSSAWPTELRLKDKGRLLAIRFEDGASFELAAEFLRVHSPSAEVQGHSASERKIVGGKQSVAIRDIVPTGNYAVRLVFDDGHETGIFTWARLHEMGAHAPDLWQIYLNELASKGLARDRPGEA